jgi:serine/threonine-protein kinase HipA
MADRTLEVWCFDAHAGMLIDEPGGMQLAYAESWRAAGRPPLSHSLPLDGSYTAAAVGAFFGGLLPEGAPRARAARNLGVSADNDFALLAALGGDTAGAISLLAPGERPEPVGREVRWLSDSELATLIDELPSRPLHADEDGEYRLSLAGAQDKLPVVLSADGQIGLTKGRTPSTHILKIPIAGHEGTIANEALCPAIGRILGIETAHSSPRRVAGREFLLVERYDREHADGLARRLHQEDFCQALGIPARRKYQSEGGPALEDCFALLREAVAVPAREALKLLDAVVLSFLVGNNDAHGKNYSLLYLPGSPQATLAPAYDLLSTVVYPGLSRKMAMSISGEYRADYVQPRHLNQMLQHAGLGPAAARRRIRSLAAAAPAAARQAQASLTGEGWSDPVLDRIVATVEKRAARLLEIAAPSARVGARRGRATT